MRIGIDIRPLQAETRHRGIGKSLEFFLKAALPLLRDDTVVFYVDGTIDFPETIRRTSNVEVVEFNSHPITRKKYVRSIVDPWRPLQVKAGEVDVLLQYDASLGIPKTVPVCVIFHDLIPYIFHSDEVAAAKSKSFKRTLKNRLAGTAYWQQYQRFLRRYSNANSIIAISDSSKNDYINHFKPIKNQRIVTIPHGVDESFFVDKQQKISNNLARQITKPFFFYVGGIDYRKNVKGLLRDFIELRKTRDAQLVLAGKEFALQDQLNDLGWQEMFEDKKTAEYASDIIRPGFVSHEDLIALLSRANALVFPSKYEGFGMPLLEAMAVGCPVITYGNSSLKEVVGKDGTILPEGASFVKVMQSAIDTPEKFADLAVNAKRRAKEFTWENTAKAIIKELRFYSQKDTGTRQFNED